MVGCSVTGGIATFFFLNFIFWAGGATLLGIGIWMKIDPIIQHYLQVTNIADSDPYIDWAATIFIAAGSLMIVLGIFGFCAARQRKPRGLALYAIVLLAVMALEITGGVLAIIYRQKVQDNLMQEMKRQMRQDYYNNEETLKTKEAWDYLQVQLECCGARVYTDWRGITNATNEYVPTSCCVPLDKAEEPPRPKNEKICQLEASQVEIKGVTKSPLQYLNRKGCQAEVMTWFETHSLVMGLLGLVVGGTQVFAVICACVLRNVLSRKE